MYATSVAQRNVLKATVPDRMVRLPKPACVIAAVRMSKALKEAKQSARPCCPLPKLLLIKTIYHLNTLHLYPAKTNKDSKTNKERVTDFLYQAVELSTSACSIFTENEGLVQIKVTIINHDVGPDYKLH